MMAKSGSAKVRRQNPAAAGPVPVRRIRIPEKPMTQAPNTSAPMAGQRGVWACGMAKSVKTQAPRAAPAASYLTCAIRAAFRSGPVWRSVAVDADQKPVMTIERRRQRQQRLQQALD